MCSSLFVGVVTNRDASDHAWYLIFHWFFLTSFFLSVCKMTTEFDFNFTDPKWEEVLKTNSSKALNQWIIDLKPSLTTKNHQYKLWTNISSVNQIELHQKPKQTTRIRCNETDHQKLSETTIEQHEPPGTKKAEKKVKISNTRIWAWAIYVIQCMQSNCAEQQQCRKAWDPHYCRISKIMSENYIALFHSK